ncbi:MAG: polymer-forming cytoskeletal protein [Thermodesulfobacteriota bacterium]|nr:polymer-forming cytoskeletal protein [Thermodesulfobacteriota bacterium]
MKKKEIKREGEEKEINAFLGRDTEFTGKLIFNGAVRLDGKFSGEIFTGGNLIVGDTAVIDADIEVDNAVISGRVNGDVKAKSKVELNPPGKLFGNINTPVLVINEGVVFEGNCKMGSKIDGEENIAIFNEIKEKKGILNEDIEIEENVERRSLS